jgi:hypothetical protein
MTGRAKIGRNEMVRRSLLAGAASLSLFLAACGGAGTDVASTPPSPPTPSPSPTPTPTPASPASLMRVEPASQEFAVKGATFTEVAFPNYNGPLTATGDLLRIRYDAGDGTYEILEPKTNDWRAIAPDSSATPLGVQWTTDAGDLYFHVNNDLNKAYEDGLYSYSALVGWSLQNDPDQRGAIAFGVASDPSAIPVSGSATFDGSIYGFTTETWDWADWGRGLGTVDGTIQLTFDFGAGSLAGSISPRIYVDTSYELPTMEFVQTVFSKGSTTFSGKFATPLTGANAFSGMFTGPQASELIGSFVFPYKPVGSTQIYEAGGGFIAKK